MARNLLLIIVLIGLLTGCSNLMTADPPTRVLAGIHEFGTTALAFTPEGQHFISGGLHGEIKVWDTATLSLLGELNGHRRAVRAILPLGPDAFVSGGDDGRLILWHGNRITAQVDGAKVRALALFRGMVVSGHNDHLLRVWSTDALHPLREIPLGGDVVALSAHDGQLAVGLAHSILLLDANFQTRRELPAPHTPHDLQFSPDGRQLAAGTWFRLNLWDLTSGQRRSVATEHNGLVTSLAFSPDGRYLATIGRNTDSAVRVVDAKDFTVIRRFQAHKLCGSVIRFSPDGRTLASGSDDESVRLYTIGPPDYSSKGAIPSAH